VARAGVELEDGLVRPRAVSARAGAPGTWEFELTLTEGRKREVRRLCQALGLRVDRLVRTRYGPVELGALRAGESRPLRAGERAAIDAMVSAASG
jgi:23S rRNA pseudouridine2605 synthase